MTTWSKRKTGLVEEAEQELLVAADAADTAMGGGHGVADLQVAAVGELASFEVGPQALGRVEIGGVGGQPLDFEPATLSCKESLHDLAVVAAEAIPEQEHGPAAEGAAELVEKVDQAQVVVGVGPEVEVEPSPTAIPAVAEGGRRRDPLPVALAVAEHWGLPSRRPRRAHVGRQREAALVFEDDPGAAGNGVFFSSGQRSLTQVSIFSSSRSTALRAGFWRVQPSPRRTLQTWPS